MDNNFQGKYFSFFNLLTSKLQIIKFKKKEEQFYAANTVWESKIISNFLFELHFDDRPVSQLELDPFDDKIDILHLEKTYFRNENINFTVVNREYDSFTFAFIVHDVQKNFYYHREENFQKTDQYRVFNFKLHGPGDYRISFYINNKFQYYFFLRIREETLSKYSINLEKGRNTAKMKFFPEDYQGEVEFRYWNLNNFTENYNAVSVVSEETLEELYVPLNELFDANIKSNDFQKFIKLRLEGKYNAMGILKIIESMKVMNTKEEVKFIENLFREEREIGMTLVEIIFDFDLLFLNIENEAREILQLVDDYTLIIALKGETKNRLEHIQRLVSEKRWEKLSGLFDKIDSIKLEKADMAQKKIGTIIRSYYQKKFGVPFIFDRKERTRCKIKNFSINAEDEILLPQFNYNGNYLVEGVLRTKSTVNFIHRVTNARKEYKFYIKNIYSTSDFFEVVNIDEKHIYIRFLNDIKMCSIAVYEPHNAMISDFSAVYQDEIIHVTYKRSKSIRMIIGAVRVSETHPVDESDVLINLYDMVDNTVFVPDAVKSSENIPFQNLKEYNGLFYIKQSSIPQSPVYGIDDDISKPSGRELQEFHPDQKIDIIIKEIKDSDELPNYIINNYNCFLLFFMQDEDFFVQNSGIYSFNPVIVRKIGKRIYIYNLTSQPGTVKIVQDDNELFDDKVNDKFFEYSNFEENSRIKVQVKIDSFEYNYYFLPETKLDEYEIKKMYQLKGIDIDKLLNYLYRFRKRYIIHLIIEIKIYRLKYEVTEQEVYRKMLNITVRRLGREYFRGEYFIYTPESDFNSLDIVDILFHLEELYRNGLDGLDRMIESTFLHMKKIKFKNKQLHDYTGKKRFKIF